MSKIFPSKLHFLPLLSAALFFLGACTSGSKFIKADEAVYERAAATNRQQRQTCRNWRHYDKAPFLEGIPTRKVRVNIHFMNNRDSTLSFNEKMGTSYAKTLVYQSNQLWANNAKMNLPIGNNTPVLPVRLEMVLTPDPAIPGDDGIYFHYNDTLCVYNSADQWGTLLNRTQYNRYGRQKGEVLNIFLMEHVPDSLSSATYVNRNHGVGYPNWIKVIGTKQNQEQYYLDENGDTIHLGAWYMARLFNHELGHAFGLPHAWTTHDGCDDTPANPNCWNYTNSGPCDSLVSNNVMDYNTYQNAVTPCQIGRIHLNFSREGTPQRQKLVKDFCHLDSTKNLRLASDDTIHIRGYHDFYGNVTIGSNTIVMVHCDIHMPAHSKITLQPNAQLILDNATIDNACDYQWKGIKAYGTGRTKGKVILKGHAKVENATRWIQNLEPPE